SYSYRAHYSGDPNFAPADGPLEPFSVSMGTSTTVTEIHNASHVVVTTVPANTTVHDKATVTGSPAVFTPTGTVEYRFYNTIDCTGSFTSETVSVGSESGSHGPLAPGSYSFMAIYSGDSNYAGSSSDCEPLTVFNPDSNTTTTIHNAAHQPVTTINLGDTV